MVGRGIEGVEMPGEGDCALVAKAVVQSRSSVEEGMGVARVNGEGLRMMVWQCVYRGGENALYDAAVR